MSRFVCPVLLSQRQFDEPSDSGPSAIVYGRRGRVPFRQRFQVTVEELLPALASLDLSA